eukprot:TRINITY_DN66552_c0_g1_i1.p1 TRINITY_DN66552_c0_g1~~TRINITY_DN66552_c0_g1_i1.p1  ORF type:complete len:299 (+),score=31.30 TRINITY_DN66552_c0_g1_i1:105-899(+)
MSKKTAQCLSAFDFSCNIASNKSSHMLIPDDCTCTLMSFLTLQDSLMNLSPICWNWRGLAVSPRNPAWRTQLMALYNQNEQLANAAEQEYTNARTAYLAVMSLWVHQKWYFRHDGIPLGQEDAEVSMVINLWGDAKWSGFATGCGRAGAYTAYNTIEGSGKLTFELPKDGKPLPKRDANKAAHVLGTEYLTKGCKPRRPDGDDDEDDDDEEDKRDGTDSHVSITSEETNDKAEYRFNIQRKTFHMGDKTPEGSGLYGFHYNMEW